MDTLYLVGRLVLGLYFILAGANHFMNLKNMAGYAASKGLPQAKASVAVSGLMLLLGGLGVLFHVELRWAYAVLIIFLVVAAFAMHNYWKTNDPMAAMGDKINFQKNLALAAALAMLLAQVA